MSTFSQLKQFPFFRKISHWFYPFDPQYQDIAKLSLGNDEQKISLLNILMNSDVFCNSDKYSFCFTMLQMPESQRNLMQQQLNGQHEASEELKERLKEMSQSKARAEFVSRQYIHDLYRFFKLWSRRHEIHDIFEDTLDLWNKEALSQALLHKEYINKLADTYSHTTTWQKPEFSMINQLNYTIVKMPNYGRKQVSFIRKSVPIKKR